MDSLNHSSTHIVKVDGWDLRVEGHEPTIRDLDLAARLGFEDPHKIRALIRRHATAGNIKPFAFMATAAENERGRPGREYWLTEGDALFVCAKSETERATAITKEVIRVFMLARRQSQAIQPANDAQFATALVKLVEIVATGQSEIRLLSAKVDSITSRMDRDNTHGMIGRAKAREMLDEAMLIASVEFSRTTDRSGWTRCRARIESQIRKAADLPNSRRIQDMSSDRQSHAWRRLRELRTEATSRVDAARAARAPRARQLALPSN